MIATALRETLADGSFSRSFWRNALAGITVGIVALPLSMGLAIATGVAPQHGLYTAIIGGIVIALLGGSRVNISGPTAAFVVILIPVVQQFGLGGLLLAGLLAGLILIAFGLLRLGRLIQVIPYPVVIGFTAGIGTVIALLQIKDFLGLEVVEQGHNLPERMLAIFSALPSLQWQELLMGAFTFAVLVLWKRGTHPFSSRIPAYLMALLLATLAGAVFNANTALPAVDTIATRFSYSLGDMLGSGIPALAPQLVMPWNLPSADGTPIGFSFSMLQLLLGSAFAIALLGALESLLCAVVADGMSGFKHDPDAELVGQGIGNIAVAFFAGIPATAAIARTATNVRSGASTPVAAVVHALFVLLAMLLAAPWLSLIPMAAMAAVLMMVAWNMSEARHALRILRRAPRSDAAVFALCYVLTVMIDMEVAVAAGVALASLLFMRRLTELTKAQLIVHHPHTHEPISIPGVMLYDVDGPLFFGAAHKALKVISAVDRAVHTVVLDLKDVHLLDTTAMMNLESIARELARRGTRLYLIHLLPRLEQKIRRYGVMEVDHGPQVRPDLAAVLAEIEIAG